MYVREPHIQERVRDPTGTRGSFSKMIKSGGVSTVNDPQSLLSPLLLRASWGSGHRVWARRRKAFAAGLHESWLSLLRILI